MYLPKYELEVEQVNILFLDTLIVFSGIMLPIAYLELSMSSKVIFNTLYTYPFLKIARYSATVAEILVTIILRNFEQLQTKRTAPDSHYVTLIIGDADNQLVFRHKIM